METKEGTCHGFGFEAFVSSRVYLSISFVGLCYDRKQGGLHHSKTGEKDVGKPRLQPREVLRGSTKT